MLYIQLSILSVHVVELIVFCFLTICTKFERTLQLCKRFDTELLIKFCVQITVLLPSRPGLGFEDPRGHHLEVLPSDGQVSALALVMQFLAFKKRSWSWIDAKAMTFLRLEKSPEHFQIKDAEFVWCYRTMCVQRKMSARLLIIFTLPLSACNSQQVKTLRNHDKLK